MVYYIVHEPKTFYTITENGDIITTLSGDYITPYPEIDAIIIDVFTLD